MQNQPRTLLFRGCPFKCSYCASPVLNHDCFVQTKTEKVLRVIDYLTKELGIEEIAFYDDALLVNAEKHIVPLLEEIIKKCKREIRFHTPNGLHVRFIDVKIAEFSPIPVTAEFEKVARSTYLPLRSEPLLHNNLCFQLWNNNIGYEDLIKIKGLIKK